MRGPTYLIGPLWEPVALDYRCFLGSDRRRSGGDNLGVALLRSLGDTRHDEDLTNRPHAQTASTQDLAILRQHALSDIGRRIRVDVTDRDVTLLILRRKEPNRLPIRRLADIRSPTEGRRDCRAIGLNEILHHFLFLPFSVWVGLIANPII